MTPPGHHSLFTDGKPVDFPAVTMLMASRPLLEREIRRRVESISNVDVIHARAIGLQHGGGTIQGITYQLTDSETKGGRVLGVDVAVDAMGRGSRMASWLEEDGFPAPVLHRIPVGISYTTALFSRLQSRRESNISCALNQIVSTPPGVFPSRFSATRQLVAVAAYAIEGDRWQVVVITRGYDRMKMTPQDVRDVCAGLPVVFREATLGPPIGEPASFYYGDSRRRSPMKTEDLPIGLFSVGDSVASFNPIHGEGISIAARQAAILAEQFSATDDMATRTREFIRNRELIIGETWNSEEMNGL
ncbi:hypothetical protein O3S80_00995 [Streptomyces sp. Lzd4kr]|nr:hypothetical protein [Streptomyces sp. Lzd4kr]